ncbi:MAG: hypothetical protein UX81_C0001G0009 [Parcubacteria group bacterium GW2011_GWA2_47_12]|uniref:DUF2283 domain-containing protein n=1 Tax=Candidatus Giovannonibacteria bacterium RIFCSPLOWO2_01_FULL_44_16 TaxID=1798348 RepID=A0A1F5X287_9BACT|nr:MAG: hypothetical protein UX81_C0001G0009 [Parcubacteria group bacterium GW2011_GWA2_47_12]OGF82002.1 MAG: hypothetical protein A2924_04325 [Candidatus Giovannonibacteria bacterium RIFCSPLOWO2_01_FULL_44_16]
MRIIYDPLADAVSITIKKGKVAKTKEIGQDTLLDLDKNGNPLYLEILDARKHFRKNKKELGIVEFVPVKYSKRALASLAAK